MKNEKLSTIAKRIVIDTRLSEAALTEILTMFYDFARENGVRRGTETGGGGLLLNNPEWSMCQVVFIDTIKRCIEMAFMFDDDAPEDLDRY